VKLLLPAAPDSKKNEKSSGQRVTKSGFECEKVRPMHTADSQCPRLSKISRGRLIRSGWRFVKMGENAIERELPFERRTNRCGRILFLYQKAFASIASELTGREYSCGAGSSFPSSVKLSHLFGSPEEILSLSNNPST
jgi:hypothetical protein